jgi:hypothetical protein
VVRAGCDDNNDSASIQWPTSLPGSDLFVVSALLMQCPVNAYYEVHQADYERAVFAGIAYRQHLSRSSSRGYEHPDQSRIMVNTDKYIHTGKGVSL